MAAPTSIIIPASPLDAQLLSTSSPFAFIASSSRTTVISPASQSSAQGKTSTQLEPQHFITKRQFEKWQVSQPKESRTLRPPAASDGVDKMTLQGYRAPQHPASHLLQSIPPRAPSRSSRSNILSYTLHLATASRLSSYSSEHGTRTLLHWAEADQRQQGAYEDVLIDSEWFEAEQKTQGLWKLGSNLLVSGRREGVLPPSVERRVMLAGLAEELLVTPSGERAVTKIDEDAVHPSADLDELIVLKPLTSPDTTTLYLSTSMHAMRSRSPRDRSHSVAQSLIDLKFGGKPSEPTLSPPVVEDEPHDPGERNAESSRIPNDSVFDGQPQAANASTSSSDLTATPHMDYRIVLSQSMRSRAKSIFASSPLPSLTYSFCRRHRVSACPVCTTLLLESSERVSDHAQHRRRNIPGAGLRSTGLDGGDSGTKKALVALVPTFLKLSADFLADSKARSRTDAEGADLEAVDPEQEATRAKLDVHATSAWYELLTSLLTQACLEGYLVDGWTGTEGIETLFGVGCGVWEGRGWSTASRAAPPLRGRTGGEDEKKGRRTCVRDEGATNGEDRDTDEADDEDDEADAEDVRARLGERHAADLVEAAHALFGSREVAQADYERSLRDRIHEFLNVPQDKTLIQHLTTLSNRYPLSAFEDEVVNFFEACVRALGRPALATFEPEDSTSLGSVPSAAERPTPDTLALLRYFAVLEGSGPASLNHGSRHSRLHEKRRRLA